MYEQNFRILSKNEKIKELEKSFEMLEKSSTIQRKLLLNVAAQHYLKLAKNDFKSGALDSSADRITQVLDSLGIK